MTTPDDLPVNVSDYLEAAHESTLALPEQLADMISFEMNFLGKHIGKMPDRTEYDLAPECKCTVRRIDRVIVVRPYKDLPPMPDQFDFATGRDLASDVRNEIVGGLEHVIAYPHQVLPRQG